MPPMALAEFNRKESKFRQEKQAWDQQRKTAEQTENDRKANEEKWKRDPVALFEAFGYSQDQVIDYLAKGGADSAENRVRLLETKIEKQERERREADEKAQQLQVRNEIFRRITTRVDELIKDDKYELCAKTPNIANEVISVIVNSYNHETGDEMTPEQALDALETELDRRWDVYAQSKKLKAKLSSPPPTDKPKEGENKAEGTTADSSVPPANQKRTITIKNRQQAVAPIRPTSSALKTRQQVVSESAERLAKFFASKANK